MPIRFRRKPGLGCHRFKVGGTLTIVRSGEVVVCTPYDLGSRIDQYDCLDGDLPVKVKAKPRVPEIVPNEKLHFYDIVNPDYPDRPLNEEPLRKKAAQHFLDNLIGEVEYNG